MHNGKSMKNQWLILALLGLFSISLPAQQVTGEYFLAGQGGELVLKLHQSPPNQVTGTLTDQTGVQYKVQATEEASEVMGTLTNAQGGMYFEAYTEGDELHLTLIPPNAMQQPDYDRAQTFSMQRRGSTSGLNSAAPAPQGGLGGPLGEAGYSLGSSGWNGTFSGDVNGTPATMRLQHTGQQLSGEIDAAGYKYQLSGTVSANRSQGQMLDPQTRGQLSYSGVLEGDIATLTFSGQGGQSFQIRFSRSSAGQSQGGFAPYDPSGDQDGAQQVERDARLIGGWLYTDSYTSGEYSFATQWRLIINADGSYLYGDAKVAGGGGGISGSSGGGDVTRGQWRTENNVIYINDGTGWQPYARYTTDGGSLLMQFGDGSKQLWKRNN